MRAEQTGTGSFVVVSVDQVKRGVADVQSVLRSLNIAVDVVESGRRLHWNTAVVLRVPEQRIPEVMIALGMHGFTDVMAYQSSGAHAAGKERVGESGRQCGQTTSQHTERSEKC